MATVLLPDGSRIEINDLKETREVEVFIRGAGNKPTRIPYAAAFAMGTMLQAYSRFGLSY